MTAKVIGKQLEAMGFKRITPCSDCEDCLFFREEETTASLADSGSGIILTMQKADWRELCKKIKAGEVA